MQAPHLVPHLVPILLHRCDWTTDRLPYPDWSKPLGVPDCRRHQDIGWVWGRNPPPSEQPLQTEFLYREGVVSSCILYSICDLLSSIFLLSLRSSSHSPSNLERLPCRLLLYSASGTIALILGKNWGLFCGSVGDSPCAVP